MINKKGTVIGSGQAGKLFNIGSLQFTIQEIPSEKIEIVVKGANKRAEELQKKTSASQIKNTYLVLLKAKSHSPELAADIANTLANKYIGYSLETITEAAGSSKVFIEEQIFNFGLALDSAEENLREYKEMALARPSSSNLYPNRLLVWYPHPGMGPREQQPSNSNPPPGRLCFRRGCWTHRSRQERASARWRQPRSSLWLEEPALPPPLWVGR